MTALLVNLASLGMLAWAVWFCIRHLVAFMREADAKQKAREQAARARHPSTRSKMLAHLDENVLGMPKSTTRQFTEDDPEWIQYAKRLPKRYDA